MMQQETKSPDHHKLIHPALNSSARMAKKSYSLALLLFGAFLTSCDTAEKDYLETFNITFGLIMGLVIVMAIFSYLYSSRKRLKEDKKEEAQKGTGTPTR